MSAWEMKLLGWLLVIGIAARFVLYWICPTCKVLP